MSGGVRRVAAEDNRLRPEDRAVHDWYRFVLSFPPHLVRTYLERFEIGAGDTVLDPFCGTGTTLVECKKLGIASVGVERNPMAHLASRAKLNWRVDWDGLIDNARAIAALALERLHDDCIDDEPATPLFNTVGRLQFQPRLLPPEADALLLKNSISPLPLHKVLTLLEVIEEQGRAEFADHQRLALARVIVNDASNLQFGPEVGVGAPKGDAAVVAPWLNAVKGMAEDIRDHAATEETPSTVHLADSRDLAALIQPESIAAVITSPPYPNEKDYTRTTRLESVILGLLKDKSSLRALKQELVRSNTRSVYKQDADHEVVSAHREIQRIADEIEQRRIELGKTSGFERMYARVTKLYFGGMARHLAGLRSLLRPGARLGYVVGDQASYLRVMIRTGELLADLARDLGYEIESIDLFRTRLATATREMLREEVVVLRWPSGRASKTQRQA